MSHIQLRHFLMEQAVSKRSQGLWRKALSRGEVDDIQSEPRLDRYMKRVAVTCTCVGRSFIQVMQNEVFL